jgi:hypothetical protein
MPGQFFTLKFDFSATDRSSNHVEAGRFLKNNINASLLDFYHTYAMYLGEDVDKLSRNIDPETPADNLKRCVRLVEEALSNGQKNGHEQLAGVRGIYLLVDEYDAITNGFLEPYNTAWQGSAIERVFTSFWSTIKALRAVPYGIRKAFITGIAPLSLAGAGSGFNVAKNLSSSANAAGLCGLTRADIEAALEKVCGSDIDAYKTHLQDMTMHLNGYHFCNHKTLETVYNTDTCLAYLEDVMNGNMADARDPMNSEVSQEFLRRFAASPSAIADFETGLKRDSMGNFVPFKYDKLKENFGLKDLERDPERGQPGRRSMMLCHGALTFYPKDPAHYLKVPNLVAAERIAEAVLEKYELRDNLRSVLERLEIDGDIRPVLRCYRDLMVQRDVHVNDFQKSEEIHRDSFYFSLLHNAALRPHAEFQLTKPNKAPGRCDIVLPVHKHLIVMEWKALPIDFLDIPIPKQRSKRVTTAIKASVLSKYSCDKVLDINFGKNDKFHVGKLQEWIIDEVAPQLKSYILSEEMKKMLLEDGRSLKAHIVIIVGSRQILVWDMDGDGKLAEAPDLVERTA